ncbi:MAG: glycoside hydrolase family 26 protein [Treponema sp.]|nr:glycoside hydrolase family 26 protein [Treponema sp.]
MATPYSQNRLSKEAADLMAFLHDNYGKKIISGQMTCTWNYNVDCLELVHKDTGKYPLIAGFDFMNMVREPDKDKLNEKGEVLGQDGKYHQRHGHLELEKAEAWHNKGGIVTFCWHWYVTDEKGNTAFYANNENGWKTDFRIPYDSVNSNPSKNIFLLDESTEEFKQLKKGAEKVAGYLEVLKAKHIPVLWRPLHEASGTWFWWGCGNKEGKYKNESFIALWRWLQDLFNQKELNNLIWVYNGQDKNLYPGDDYCDIISEDIYASVSGKTDLSSQLPRFQSAASCQENSPSQKKMIALSETGTIPNVDACLKDGATWSWFMVWNDCRFENNLPAGDEGNFWSGELHNPLEHRKTVYADPRIITLDD